jgi:hypothetical protein
MIRSDSNDRLVQALGADLTPVRRLAPPGLRLLMWLTILAAAALALAMASDVRAMIRRLLASLLFLFPASVTSCGCNTSCNKPVAQS